MSLLLRPALCMRVASCGWHDFFGGEAILRKGTGPPGQPKTTHHAENQKPKRQRARHQQQGPLPQGSIGRKVTTGRQSRATHESMHATCSPEAAQCSAGDEQASCRVQASCMHAYRRYRRSRRTKLRVTLNKEDARGAAARGQARDTWPVRYGLGRSSEPA